MMTTATLEVSFMLGELKGTVMSFSRLLFLQLSNYSLVVSVINLRRASRLGRAMEASIGKEMYFYRVTYLL